MRSIWHKPCRRLAAAVAAAVPLAALAPASAAGQDARAHAERSGEASGTEVTSSEASSVRIGAVSCVPATQCSSDSHRVAERGTLLLEGEGLSAGMAVAFPRTSGGDITSSSPVAHLRQEGANLELTVPLRARSGYIAVLLGDGRHSNFAGPLEVRPHSTGSSAPAAGSPAGSSPFEGQGMWIWHVSSSDGGDIAAIAAKAHAADVSTLFIKSSDGSEKWFSQFTPELVAQLHADGLKACAWQYVYGTHPAAEAAFGARAVADGADCLVIDAEAQYEGRYAAAQRYLADLRAEIGAAYPLGLTSLAYVFQHLAFPYSVFLGPGGAQFNLPQMYWKDIGVSVNSVFATTYVANDVYGRPIFPLGQTYDGVSAAEVLHFRRDALQYGATGTSFWDFEETRTSGWEALAEPLAPLSGSSPLSSNTSASTSVSASSVSPAGAQVRAAYPELGLRATGDPVLWMQEHLARAIPAQETTGRFNAATMRNLMAFQRAHAITPSGRTNAATWAALLALPPVAVDWTGSSSNG